MFMVYYVYCIFLFIWRTANKSSVIPRCGWRSVLWFHLWCSCHNASLPSCHQGGRWNWCRWCRTVCMPNYAFFSLRRSSQEKSVWKTKWSYVLKRSSRCSIEGWNISSIEKQKCSLSIQCFFGSGVHLYLKGFGSEDARFRKQALQSSGVVILNIVLCVCVLVRGGPPE